MAETPAQIRIPTRGGEVILSTPAEHTAYDEWNHAPARRAGDYVYVSGVVVARQPEGPRTPETFKDATRRTFATLRARLQALGADFADVVIIDSYRDWSAPEFHGDRMAQFTALGEGGVHARTPPGVDSRRHQWSHPGTGDRRGTNDCVRPAANIFQDGAPRTLGLCG
jgi:enamine deaminase RidA (YjgF/YER057c/UK114 family)